MKQTFFFLLLAAVVVNSKAQTQNADSLKQQLTLKLSDTSRLNTLARLGYYYQDSKPDSLLYYGKQTLEFAQHVNDAKIISVASIMMERPT